MSAPVSSHQLTPISIVPSTTSPTSSGRSSPSEKEKKETFHTSDQEADDSVDSFLTDEQELKKFYVPIPEYEGRHRFDPEATWTEKEERSIVWKIDSRVMSLACLIFFALQLDRGNISSALSDNMLDDLGMTTNEYNNGMSIFYVAFLAAELPSQLISKRIGAERMLPIQVFLWSIVTVCQAFIQGRSSFYATRALLGLFEGGLIPDMILFLSYWYKTDELPTRLSFFWVAQTTTSIVGSFLAFALLRLRGLHGWAGWRYLFVVEGCITLAVGAFAAGWLPASPTQTKGGFRGKEGWFNEREEVILVNRVLRDDPSKGTMHNRQALTWVQIKECLADFDNWPLYLIGISNFLPFNPSTSYLTLTLRSLGFDTFKTNLLVIPSSVLWIINCFAITWVSRKLNERTLVCSFNQVWGLVLLIALVTIPDNASPWVRYALTSFLVGFPYSHPILVAWNSTNSNSVRLRTVSASLYNICVQIGSIIGTQVYRASDKPYYKKGNRGLLGVVAYNIVLFASIKIYFVQRNRQKKAQWKAFSKEEKDHYIREVAPTAGNKSLLFEFKH